MPFCSDSTATTQELERAIRLVARSVEPVFTEGESLDRHRCKRFCQSLLPKMKDSNSRADGPVTPERRSDHS